MPGPSSIDLQTTTAPPSRLRADIRTRAAGGAYFAALSSRLNSTCSNSTAIEPQQRQIGRDIDLDAVAGQHLAGALQRAPTISPTSISSGFELDRAGFQPGHVEQVADEAVQPLGLVLDGASSSSRAASS